MTWPTSSRHSRGYGSAWDKRRLQILRRDNHLCQCDLCKGGRPGGRILLASEVNHIVPKAKAKAMGWTDAQIDHPSNLQAINEDCHKRITAEQMGKVLRVRGCGIDGMPRDPGHHWNLGGASSRSPSDLPPDRIAQPCARSSIQKEKGRDEPTA